MKVPEYHEARIESGDLTQCPPVEYQADAVVTFSNGKPVLTVVVEVQRAVDHGKRWSWPVYLAAVRARARCPAILLVVCTDARTARWCAEPIEMGHPGWRLAPMVVSPEVVPVVTDPTEAIRVPELAVLSALAHGGDVGGQRVLEALLTALSTLEEGQAKLYADFVMMKLPEAASKQWEVLMAAGTYEYQSDFARKYFAEGKQEGIDEGIAAGKADAIVMILSGRSIVVTQEARSRIESCTDVAQLDEWLQRALTAVTVEDLFLG
ncbi:hypothetical protein Ssi03_71210 [Sphaerisporangium siamense]|nr:hypothetical protein Ssi03_71210 [Sphaerisporangium siamense]